MNTYLNISNIVNVDGVLSSNRVELKIPITSNIDNLNAFVEIDYPSDFSFINYKADSINPSSYDDSTKKWTVSVNKDEIAVLELELEFNEPTDLTKDYNFSWSVTGIDTDLGNNTKNAELNYKKVFTTPLGATNPSVGCGGSVNVTDNDTACTNGVSEWRLNTDSIVNSTSNNWNNGQGCFNYVDPTLPITGTYDLYCVFNGVDTLISCDETFTIPALLDNKNIFNHTISFVKGNELSADEIELLESQHNLTAVDYCWHVIKNGDGVVTSGLPLNCEEEDVDNRTRSVCLDQDYIDGTMPTELSDITNNESGDNAIILYNNGVAAYKWIWTNTDCTEGEWVLCKFVNSAGQGSAGPMGPMGLPGTNGVDGVNGDSAYETWLSLGNTGTEQDFVDSLQGQDGSIAPLVVDETLSGDGSAANPLSVVTSDDWGNQVAETDATINGDGTVINPLSVNFDYGSVSLDSSPISPFGPGETVLFTIPSSSLIVDATYNFNVKVFASGVIVVNTGQPVVFTAKNSTGNILGELYLEENDSDDTSHLLRTDESFSFNFIYTHSVGLGDVVVSVVIGPSIGKPFESNLGNIRDYGPLNLGSPNVQSSIVEYYRIG